LLGLLTGLAVAAVTAPVRVYGDVELRRGSREDAEMGIADVVLNYVKAVQWPVVVVTLAVVFRVSIRSILGRLSELSGAGVSARFEHQAEAAAGRAASMLADHLLAPQPAASPLPARKGTGEGAVLAELPDLEAVLHDPWYDRANAVDPIAYYKNLTALRERFRELGILADEDPALAVRAAWREMRTILRSIALVQGLPPFSSISDILDHLEGLGMDAGLADIARTLEKMYRQVDEEKAHVTAKAARSYLSTARTVATALGPGYIRPASDEAAPDPGHAS
jgi:hypothetical protein